MPDYEIIKSGNLEPSLINPACPGVNLVCPGYNAICPGTNASCADVGCGSDSNCFPCENPGFGCRHGCGGASSSCAEPESIHLGK